MIHLHHHPHHHHVYVTRFCTKRYKPITQQFFHYSLNVIFLLDILHPSLSHNCFDSLFLIGFLLSNFLSHPFLPLTFIEGLS